VASTGFVPARGPSSYLETVGTGVVSTGAGGVAAGVEVAGGAEADGPPPEPPPPQPDAARAQQAAKSVRTITRLMSDSFRSRADGRRARPGEH
jgi:hypothetical protein